MKDLNYFSQDKQPTYQITRQELKLNSPIIDLSVLKKQMKILGCVVD